MAENPASRSGYRLNGTAPISFSRSKTTDLEFRSRISRTFSSDSIAFTKIAPETQEGPVSDYRSSNIRSKPTEGPYLWRAPLVPAQLSRSACRTSRVKHRNAGTHGTHRTHGTYRTHGNAAGALVRRSRRRRRSLSLPLGRFRHRSINQKSRQ